MRFNNIREDRLNIINTVIERDDLANTSEKTSSSLRIENKKRKSANLFRDALVPFAERRKIIMKKYLLLLMTTFLFLYGCSSTGDTSSYATESSTTESNSEVASTEANTEEASTEFSEIISDNTNTTETISGVIESSESVVSSETESTEAASASNNSSITSTEKDVYVGSYCDSTEKESTMVISSNGDGSYSIEIIRFRLTSLECTGTLSNEGIEFTENNSPTDMKGIITINNNFATVTFTSSSWDYIKPNDTFQYEKQD